MAYKVWLDAGHGGSDPGASGNGWLEKTMNLNTTLACKAELEAYGVEVGMSRIGDNFLSLEERVRRANEWGAQFFVSIHHNAGGGDRGEVIHSILNGKGLTLAQNIQQEYYKLGQTVCKTYNKVGEGNKDYYYVIRNTTMDAIITEGCFVDNAQDMELFDTVAEQQEEGRAIARGILKTLGINAMKPGVPNVPTPVPPTPPTTAPQPPAKADVYYQVYANGRWLPEVKNLSDYAGIYGCPILGVKIRLSKGDVDYRVATTQRSYYPWVRNYSDYAGDLRVPVDMLQIKQSNIKYRAHIKGRAPHDWLPWVVGASDFAGIGGVIMDAIEIQVI